MFLSNLSFAYLNPMKARFSFSITISGVLVSPEYKLAKLSEHKGIGLSFFEIADVSIGLKLCKN
jgi:hypothetical protein